MATSILGVLISLMYVYPRSSDWGVTFTLVFGAMFLAAMASMTHADPDTFVEIETKNRRK
ncbi:TPA: hypothetical protein HA239_01335 [Candidatus Woesearchaeota archaeon]|nr:hypothetical protein [Candidatus Woesearchaeota archaeon]HIH41035.1 hypothetical protein [Candidatus Woesearchaeota archaeon]